jgi:glutamate--cysteine ligase
MSTNQNASVIEDYLRSGVVRKEERLLGFELEHFVVERDTHAMVPYYRDAKTGKAGVEDILGELEPFYDGDKAFGSDEDGNERLIGLSREKANITLEPGAQLEISIGPVCCLQDIEDIYSRFRAELDPILEKYGYELLAEGYHPTACARDVPLIPKARYRSMDAHFNNTGAHGANMMRATASTQVSIDFTNEANAVEKFRIANALGPLLAFITDNSPVFEGAPAPRRMVRTAVWDDVDPWREGTAPSTYNEGFDFEIYAEDILRAPEIAGLEVEKFADQKNKAIEHLLSMFFYDVRFKTYVEIRMADSLPLPLALSYTALIKGLFYSEENLMRLEDEFANVEPASIAFAKTALRQNGYDAQVYGRAASDWLDTLFTMARDGLDEDERPYLKPLANMVYARTTPLDCRLFKQSVDTSTAIYHGSIVPMGYVPQLYDANMLDRFDAIVATTYHILDKVTQHYISDANYRKLFGFTPLLEKLICMPCGYDTTIPIMRIDIFYDDKTGDFRFCEFNTDGTSAMNEDKACTEAFATTETFRYLSARHDIKAQELFDTWVEAFGNVYEEYSAGKLAGATGNLANDGDNTGGGHADGANSTTVAIVDYKESATTNELLEFKARFIAHGYDCILADVRDLVYDGSSLTYKADGKRINAIYRRAVTSEIIDDLEQSGEAAFILDGESTSGKTEGARALVQAVADGAVCMVGGFRTQVAHSKEIFSVLHLPQTAEFLTQDERAFVARHVPFTIDFTGAALKDANVSIEDVKSDNDSWIIKPVDGYGTVGVFAGRGVAEDEWERLVDEHVDTGYVLQEYCEQHTVRNTLPIPFKLEPWNRLTGLYTYNGKFAGTYIRAGQHALIVGFHGGITLASLLLDYEGRQGIKTRTL